MSHTNDYYAILKTYAAYVALVARVACVENFIFYVHVCEITVRIIHTFDLNWFDSVFRCHCYTCLIDMARIDNCMMSHMLPCCIVQHLQPFSWHIR